MNFAVSLTMSSFEKKNENTLSFDNNTLQQKSITISITIVTRNPYTTFLCLLMKEQFDTIHLKLYV